MSGGCTLATAVCAAWMAAVLPAAQESGAPLQPMVETFRLQMDRTAQGGAAWIVLLKSDGTGIYWPSTTAKYGGRPVHVSTQTWERVRAAADTVESGHCETKAKNIAKTGTKDVEMQIAAGTFDCQFNYSDSDSLNTAVTAAESVVATLQTGDELARLHRFDRLGLDAEMETLEKELASGAASEVENIAPVLQSIADDERVIDRVRRRAARLLEDARSDNAVK